MCAGTAMMIINIRLPPPQSSQTKSAFTATPETVADPVWYADSVVTYHITAHVKNLKLAMVSWTWSLILVLQPLLLIILIDFNILEMHWVYRIFKSLVSIPKLTSANNLFVEFLFQHLLCERQGS